MADAESRQWGSLIRVRIRYLLARVVQAAGFYLLFGSLWVLFDPALRTRGLGIDQVPAVLTAPLVSLEVSPLLTLLAGFAVVWFATSPWFLGTPQASR